MSCEHNRSIKCPCTAVCEKHQKCCACVAYHTGKGAFPACFFSVEGEKWYDRSYAALKRDRGS